MNLFANRQGISSSDAKLTTVCYSYLLTKDCELAVIVIGTRWELLYQLMEIMRL